MNKLTFKEIREILESQLFADHDYEPCRWFYDDVYYQVDTIAEYGEFKKTFQTLGSFKCVEIIAGEGKGDDYYRIFHFVDHDVYIKFKGRYSKFFGGAEYEEMFEVKPEEVTVT
jgi:hypothetical protein